MQYCALLAAGAACGLGSSFNASLNLRLGLRAAAVPAARRFSGPVRRLAEVPSLQLRAGQRPRQAAPIIACDKHY